MTATHHEEITLPLSDIKPYKNNPRINDMAVEPLADSMRLSGYDQYILVDENNVILKGHTRWKALSYLDSKHELGAGKLSEVTADRVKVIRVHGLTEKEKKKARIVDNKVAELAEWDPELLAIETADIGIDDSTFQNIDFGNLNSMMGGKDEEYQKFEDKFKPKFTTDDCFTPPEVYDAVKNWVFEQYGKRDVVIRPFYPNGDYTKEVYPKGCIVIDNPPFSIASEINAFYNEHGIDYFLFNNHLTCFNNLNEITNIVLTNTTIVYDNGAEVSTSFYTNLGAAKIYVSSSLDQAIRNAQPKEVAKLNAYDYPDTIQTSSSLGRLAHYGSEFKIYNIEKTNKLDDGTEIFGKGIIISDIMAEKVKAEKVKAEKVKIKPILSDRELAIIESLNEKDREVSE